MIDLDEVPVARVDENFLSALATFIRSQISKGTSTDTAQVNLCCKALHQHCMIARKLQKGKEY